MSDSPTWTTLPINPAAEALATALACPRPIAGLLTQRGLTTVGEASQYLNPTLADLHDPQLLLGLPEAVARILRALSNHESILIYGDYDVDGTVATVLLKTAIERIAPPDSRTKVHYHVPHRIREGYGIQPAVLAQYAQQGVTLVISVDTGIRAHAAAESAQSLGLDLIVTDHHLPETALPKALAVLNPNQPACPYPNKNLCGAGVAFKLAHALLLTAANTPEQLTRLQTHTLPSYLKLLAIATIADAVPLTGENRALVALGLRQLANPRQPGLRALMQLAELPLDTPPTPHQIAFQLAPRINAAGRMDTAADVVELFLTRSPEVAQTLATKLNQLNQTRRATEAAALTAIEAHLQTLRTSTGEYPPDCIVLDHPGWHRGVLGILASRVVDRTGRPALILTTEDGDAHGSGRSIPGFHLLDALTAIHAPAPTLFHRFGGHAHAVGFTLPAARLPTLRERLTAHSTTHLPVTPPASTICCDLALTPEDLTLELLAWITRCAPFGLGNPEPLCLVRNLIVAAPPRTIKERHLCIPIQSPTGIPPLSLLGWSRNAQPGEPPDWPSRAASLSLTPGSVLDAICRLTRNPHPHYGGIELHLVRLRPAASTVPAPLPQQKPASSPDDPRLIY